MRLKKKILLLPLGLSVAKMNGMTNPSHLLAALWFMMSLLFPSCIIRSLSYKKFKMAATKCHCFGESNPCVYISILFLFLSIRFPEAILLLLLILTVLFQDYGIGIGIIKKQSNYKTEEWFLMWERRFVGKACEVKQKL